MRTEIYITRNSIMPGARYPRDSVRVYACICIYIYIFEYRAACFIDRDKIRLHLPPTLPLSLSGSCMNHDTPVSSPWDRFFAYIREIVFETWAESLARAAARGSRERDRESETSCELNERSARELVRRPDNAQRWIIDPQINSALPLLLSNERRFIAGGR